MKVVHCPCGTEVKAESDDQLVESVHEHIKSDHPEMAEPYTRQQILEMAHEH